MVCLAAVGVWLVQCAPFGHRRGVACHLDLIWSPWGHCQNFGPRKDTVGRGRSPKDLFGCRWGVAGRLSLVRVLWGRGYFPGLSLATVGTWPVPWVLSGHREVEACPLVPICMPWGCGFSHGPCLIAGGSWPMFCVPYGRREDVASHLGLSGCCRGVPGPLNPVFPLCSRGWTRGPRLVAVWVCPGSWASCGWRVGVAGVLSPIWLPWGRCRCFGPSLAVVRAGRSSVFDRVALVASILSWALSGQGEGVAGVLGPVWPQWGRGRPIGFVWL